MKKIHRFPNDFAIYARFSSLHKRHKKSVEKTKLEIDPKSIQSHANHHKTHVFEHFSLRLYTYHVLVFYTAQLVADPTNWAVKHGKCKIQKTPR